MREFKVWKKKEIDEWRSGLEFARERLERAKSSEMQMFWRQRIEQVEEALQSYEKDAVPTPCLPTGGGRQVETHE